MNAAYYFLQTAAQLRLWHWQTTSYARHQALGWAYGEVSRLGDEFVETLQGATGTTQTMGDAVLALIDLDKVPDPEKVLVAFENFLLSMKELPSDLLNLRDEALGVVHKLRYLLTLS